MTLSPKIESHKIGSQKIDAKRQKESLVGAVALSLLLLLLVMSQGGTSHGDGYELEALFGDVTGVHEGTEVRLAGVAVGDVRSMALLENGRVVLRVAIDDDVAIPRDSAIAVQKDGLFGSTVLVIEVGGDDNFLPAGGKFLYSESALTLDDVLDAVIAQGTSAGS